MKKCLFQKKVKDKVKGITKQYVRCQYDGSVRTKCKDNCPHMKKTFMWRLFEKDGE